MRPFLAKLPDLVRVVNQLPAWKRLLTPLKTLKLERAAVRTAPLQKNQKKAFGTSPQAAHLGHQPKPGIEVLACAVICRSALATRMHDIRARTPVACISVGAINAKAVLASPVHGIFMPLGSRVLEYQQTLIRSSSDLPRIVPSHKPAWVRIADPAAVHTRLSAASEANIEWLLQCFQADLACPLRSKPILARKAAADACAEGATVGIGGWIISSRSVSWFAETWDFQEVQQQELVPFSI